VLALLARMRWVGTLDVPRTHALITSLLEIPLGPFAQLRGGVLRWLASELRSAIPAGDTMEDAISAAVSGPGAATHPRIEWEGDSYRVDLGEAERTRIARVRERQSGATIDLALEIAGLAERLESAPPTLDVAREVRERLATVNEELSRQDRRGGIVDQESLPPGVVPPPRPQESLQIALDELGRVDGPATLPLAARAAAELWEAADRAGAQALVALVYAMHLGDPEGPALLPGDVSRRHDFGLGQRDTEQRLRAAWMMPLQDVSPGVPWHIDGSLLGLDVAMASMGLRRLVSDRVLAPTLSSNERETFVVGWGLMNPFDLTDAGQAAIASAIENGRRRVGRLKEPADAARLAGQFRMDGWRRRALQWTVVNEPERVESLFALHELLALGSPPGEIDLSPWGAPALISEGCLCTRLPSPGRLPLLMGRRQIGLLATAVPDLNLHIARTLAGLRLPARLAKYVLSAAVVDFVDEVRPTDPDDWLSLVRGAALVPREQIEDYVAAAAADGPLVPDETR
jgi:hypothetical protein